MSKTLSTSCPPVLNRLYKANKIDRAKTHRGFVCLSIDSTIKRRQVSGIEKVQGLQRPSDTDTITILVEFIRNPNRTLEELASHLLIWKKNPKEAEKNYHALRDGIEISVSRWDDLFFPRPIIIFFFRMNLF